MIGTLFGWFRSLATAWKIWPLVGIGVALVAGIWLWQRVQIAELRADLVAAERDAAIYRETNRRTAESFERYIAEAERTARLLADQAARDRARAVAVDRLQGEIARAPDADAPAGALADSVLDRLRDLRSAGAGD